MSALHRSADVGLTMSKAHESDRNFPFRWAARMHDNLFHSNQKLNMAKSLVSWRFTNNVTDLLLREEKLPG
jgi:hypothetical protein